jgi:hypothetical protein
VYITDNNSLPTVTLLAPVTNLGNTKGYIEAVALDQDGTITKVEFYGNNQIIATITSAPYRASWVNAPDGLFVLTVKAYDNRNGVSNSNAVDLIVNRNAKPHNTAPMVILADPVANIGNKSGYIEAVATNMDGLIEKIEIYAGNHLLSTITHPPYRAYWHNAPNGNYQLTAKAYDDKGAMSISNTIIVIVSS